MTDREAMIAQLKAKRAARVAAGDPIAIKMQAATDRAKAEQQECDRRERERMLRLLKGKPGRPPNAKKLVAEIRRLNKTMSLTQAFRTYAQANSLDKDSVERMYRRAKTTP